MDMHVLDECVKTEYQFWPNYVRYLFLLGLLIPILLYNFEVQGLAEVDRMHRQAEEVGLFLLQNNHSTLGEWYQTPQLGQDLQANSSLEGGKVHQMSKTWSVILRSSEETHQIGKWIKKQSNMLPSQCCTHFSLLPCSIWMEIGNSCSCLAISSTMYASAAAR